MMVVAGHHHTGFVASDGTMYMCGRGDGGNIWFKSEDGPGGLSLPRQMWPRLKPVIVRTTRGLELMDPILVGPGIAWNKNLFELVRAFWMNKKDKSSLSSPWMSEVEPDVMEMIARLVLSSPMPEHAQYHKSVRMLMGSVN
jgi:hypothetical protein